MKPLYQIQEENRKAIIMACNPEAKTYEEALEVEFEEGCQVLINDHPAIVIFKSLGYYFSYKKDKNSSVQYYRNKTNNKLEILGKPLTLNRVLIALDSTEQGENCVINTCGKFYLNNCLPKNADSVDCFWSENLYWDLTKETLEEQSEECQRGTAELLTKLKQNDNTKTN